MDISDIEVLTQARRFKIATDELCKSQKSDVVIPAEVNACLTL